MQGRTNSTQLEAQHAGLRFSTGFEGHFPVQAWGSINDQRFYFRWRGRRASLTVGPPAAVQPRTAAEVWSAIIGTTTDEARTVVGDQPRRAEEVYPEGLRLSEETTVDDNLEDAADVFRSLLAQYVRAERGN